jgi:hypothetical protein
MERKLSLEPIFYVYVLLDTRKPGKFIYEKDDQKLEFDYEPYYIGKGGATNEKRPENHLIEAKKNNKNSPKLNLIRCIIKENLEFKYVYLKENLTEKEALDYEKFYISCIKRKDLSLGPLTNLTDGGEGLINSSIETKKKISETLIKNYKKENHPNYNKNHSNSTIQKISNSIIKLHETGKYKLKKTRDKVKKSWEIKINTGFISPLKNKKLEEIVGEEKALEIKKERSKKMSGKNSPSYKSISLEIQNQIIKLYQEEEKFPYEISNIFNISISKIISILKENNIHIRNSKEIKRNKKQCIFCKKEFDPRNYSRWHGNNCKLKNIN